VITYQIEDNNCVLRIIDNGEETLCSIEIHHDEREGYFIDDSFSARADDTYGTEVLQKIKDDALNELN